MTFWGGISQWATSAAVRRHAPVVGSILVHAAAGLVVTSAVLVSAANPAPEEGREPRRDRIIEIALIADSLPLPVAPKPGAPRPAIRPKAATDPAPTLGAPASTGQQPAIAGAQPADDSVSFGAPVGGLERGLAGVSGSDPCKVRVGPRPRTCGADWASKGSQP